MNNESFYLYDRKYFQSEREAASAAAEQIVPIMLDLIHPKSVVDVGCGTAAFAARFQQSGVEDVFGIDAPWIQRDMLLVPEQHFIAQDLRKPIVLSRKFDLVVCLEVAEHLPQESAETFVTSLTNLGPVILFSAAIPFQGGTNHFNEQWPDYWLNLFEARGYELVDCIRKRIWLDSRISYVYRQNIMLYVKNTRLKEFPHLQSESTSPLNLVHPDLWLGYATAMRRPGNIPARLVLRSLPYLPVKAARYILRSLGLRRKT